MPARFRAEPLSRDEIVDAALKITRTKGLPALTMRAMAAELDVTPNALYYYVKDKDELVNLVAEVVTSRFVPLEHGPDGWEEALRRYLMSMWEQLALHPGLGSYLMAQPNIGNTPESVASETKFFEEIGFSRREARMAWSFALTYIHGRLSVDARLGLDRRTDRAQRLRAKEYVSYGVEAVIDGLRARLEASAPRKSRR